MELIDTRPVLRLASERAIRTVIACFFGIGALSLFSNTPFSLPIVFDRATHTWTTPLAAMLVELGRWSIGRKQPNPPARQLGRMFGYFALPSVAFNLIWPVFAPGTVGYLVIITGSAWAIALLTEFAVIALGQRDAVRAREAMTQKAEQAVRTEAPAESAVELDAQLDYRWQQARKDVETKVYRFLPTNPRTAKRMVNHLSMAMAIAEERGMFRNSVITEQHLDKWVWLSEQWPALGAALTVRPERMGDLELAASVDEVQKILDELAPGTPASTDMLRQLQEDVQLAGVLDKLVRFEPG